MKYLLIFILVSKLYAQDAQFFRAIKVETNSTQRTGVANLRETNSIADPYYENLSTNSLIGYVSNLPSNTSIKIGNWRTNYIPNWGTNDVIGIKDQTNAWPDMIQGEISYQVRTNWIDESITKKLPEDPHNYTLHQVGQIVTNINAKFVFEGREFTINLGIKQSTNTFKRDRIFQKRMQQDTPPIPTTATNVPGELPYSTRVRIP